MLLDYTGIDDAIGAFPVHGMGGIWGVFAAGLFDLNCGAFYKYGCPLDGNGANGTDVIKNILGWQCIGIVVMIGWISVIAPLFFMVMKYFGLLRVDEDTENIGMDYAFHIKKSTIFD